MENTKAKSDRFGQNVHRQLAQVTHGQNTKSNQYLLFSCSNTTGRKNGKHSVLCWDPNNRKWHGVVQC